MENLIAIVFGLIATGVMSLLLYALGRSGVNGAEGIKGIGSSIPTQAGGSLVPGAFVHLGLGAVFGILYLLIGGGFQWAGPPALFAFGVGVGIVRGLLASLLLGMTAFDQNPLDWMSKAGMGVGTIHVIGNIVYGLSLTVLFGLSKIESSLAF